MEIADSPPGAVAALREPPLRARGLGRSLAWLLGAQFARLVLAFAVGTLLARVLGVAEYGRLATALGITTLGAFVAELGLRQVLATEMARRPRIAGALMGTGFRILTRLGVLALVGCAAVPWLMGRPDLMAPVLALSAAFLLNGHLAIFTRWDAAGEGWRAPRLALTASVVSNTAKVVCLAAGLGVVAIAAAISLECFVAAGLVFLAAARVGWTRELLRPRPTAARALLSRALPQFLAESGAFFLLRIDQVMLSALSGDEQAGIYGAATRLSELVFLLVPVLVASYLPRLASLRPADPAAYRRTVGALLGALSCAGLVAPLLWWLAGDAVVKVVYGCDFAGCGPVLLIHGLSSLAYLHGQVRSFVLVGEGRARLGAVAAFAGAALNVVLNLAWIPRFGAEGAAWATAASYYVVWVGGTFFMPGLRWLGLAQLRSLAAPLELALPSRRRALIAALRFR